MFSPTTKWSAVVLLSSFMVNVALSASCSVHKSRDDEVYIGWPFAIKCEDLFYEMHEQYFDSMYNKELNIRNPQLKSHEKNATCIILDLDRQSVVLNETVPFEEDFSDLSYNILDFAHSTSLRYAIKTWLFENQTKCYELMLNLTVVPYSKPSCKEALRSYPPVDRPRSTNKRIVFSCKAQDDLKPSIHAGLLPTNYTTTWYRDCKKLPQPSLLAKRGYDYLKPGLSISKVSLKYQGIYTCAINHNGMQRFVNSYKLQLLPEEFNFKEKITCVRKDYVTLVGQSLALVCTGNIENPNNLARYTVQWQKMNWNKEPEFECIDDLVGPRAIDSSGRKICSSHLRNSSSASGRTKPEYKLVMEFQIKQVIESDFGSYMVILIANHHKTNETLTLAEDIPATLASNSFVLGILIGLASIFLAAAGLLWWNRVYVQVIWKRKFGLSVEDDKKYGAFIVYYFSHDLDKFSQQQARDAVAAVRDALLALGYSVYDEYKDGGESGGKAEASLEYMKQCHRVVIILSSSFLKDQWNLFTLQQSFEEMIKSKSKLIFVLVPGIREYLRQHSPGDDTVRMVRRAAKLNCAIEWSDGSKFDEKYFSRRLELEMPKLSLERTFRLGSTSSTVSSQVHYKNGIRRTLSSDTHCTDVGSQDSTTGDSYVTRKKNNV